MNERNQLEYKPLGTVVADHIRNAILNGEFQPGERLNQEKIAQDLGVSRMPVREAFRLLEAEGLINVIPHRGAHVVSLSLEEMEDVYCVRMLLESAAAKMAIPKVTEGDIDRLADILRECEEATRAEDYARLYDLNDEFHRVLYLISGRKLLCEMIDKLRTDSRRFRRFYLKGWRGSLQALKDHHEILDAVRAGAAAEAEDLIIRHLEQTQKALLNAATAFFVDEADGGEKLEQRFG